MGSHRDVDHNLRKHVMDSLSLKAELLSDLGKNRIANEKVLDEWTHDGIRCQLLPDDEYGVLRLSIGGHPEIMPSDYCNFRGDKGRCIALLEKVLAAMKSH